VPPLAWFQVDPSISRCVILFKPILNGRAYGRLSFFFRHHPIPIHFLRHRFNYQSLDGRRGNVNLLSLASENLKEFLGRLFSRIVPNPNP